MRGSAGDMSNIDFAVTTVLEVARPACADEVLADEVVVLNVETGIYFSMRGSAPRCGKTSPLVTQLRSSGVSPTNTATPRSA